MLDGPGGPAVLSDAVWTYIYVRWGLTPEQVGLHGRREMVRVGGVLFYPDGAFHVSGHSILSLERKPMLFPPILRCCAALGLELDRHRPVRDPQSRFHQQRDLAWLEMAIQPRAPHVSGVVARKAYPVTEGEEDVQVEESRLAESVAQAQQSFWCSFAKSLICSVALDRPSLA